jgi:hypothetical protein
VFPDPVLDEKNDVVNGLAPSIHREELPYDRMVSTPTVAII